MEPSGEYKLLEHLTPTGETAGFDMEKLASVWDLPQQAGVSEQSIQMQTPMQQLWGSDFHNKNGGETIAHGRLLSNGQEANWPDQ